MSRFFSRCWVVVATAQARVHDRPKSWPSRLRSWPPRWRMPMRGTSLSVPGPAVRFGDHPFCMRSASIACFGTTIRRPSRTCGNSPRATNS